MPLKRIALLLALAACAGDEDPCADATTACVVVELSGPIAGLDTIAFDVAYGELHDTISLPATELPAITAIRIDAPTPTIIQVLATPRAGQTPLGGGYDATPALANPERARLALALDPAASACEPASRACGQDAGSLGDPSTVYRCDAEGLPASRGRCAHGCRDGNCLPGSACVVGGEYCGGDKVTGDPQTLYRCTNVSGTGTVIRECATRCIVSPPGQDDRCAD